MNILYYDARKVKLPTNPLESEPSDDDSDEEAHYISIGNDSRYIKGHMLDIYISLVSDLQSKIIIHVNEQEHMTNLIIIVKEQIELKYEHLRGLNGLEAKDLKRITGLDFTRGAASVSRALKSTMAFIQIKGRVGENLRPNDHLICTIDSHDVWIKLKLMIEAEVTSNFVEVELEVKIDKCMDSPMFQKVIQRLIIQIWNQHVNDKCEADSRKGIDKIYVLTEFRIVSIDIGIALQLAEMEPNEKVSQKGTGTGKIKKTKKTMFSMPDNMTVGEVFNYQNNLVIVSCHFIPLRDLYIQQVLGGQIQATASQSVKTETFMRNPSTNYYNNYTGRNESILQWNRLDSQTMRAGSYARILIPNFEDNHQQRSQQASNLDRPFPNGKSDFDYMIIETDKKAQCSLVPTAFQDGMQPQQYQYLQTTDHQESDCAQMESKNTNQNPSVDSLCFVEEEQQKKSSLVNTARVPHFVSNLITNTVTYSDTIPGSMMGESKRPHGGVMSQIQDNDLPGFGGKRPAGASQYMGGQSGVQYLFAIIQGFIVLPKRQPIAVSEESRLLHDSSARISHNNNMQPKFTELPTSSNFNLIEKEPIQISTSLMTPTLQQSRKLTEIVEVEEEEYTIKSFIQVKDSRVGSLAVKKYSAIKEASEYAEDDLEFQMHDYYQPQSTLMIRLPNGGNPHQTEQDAEPRYHNNERVKTINETLLDDSELNKATEEGQLNDSQVQESSFKYQASLEASSKQDRQLSDYKKKESGVSRNGLLQRLIEADSHLNAAEEGSNNLVKPEAKRTYTRHTTTISPNIKDSSLESLVQARQSGQVNQTMAKHQKHKSFLQRNARISSYVEANLTTQNLDNTTKSNIGTNKRESKIQKKRSSGLKIFGFFSKLRNIQKGGQKLTPQELALQVSEFEMLQKVHLPSFLLYHEDFQLIQMPPVKNFVITEKERTASQTKEFAAYSGQERDENNENVNEAFTSGSSRKNIILVTIIVLLAAMFAVGIYFAVDLANIE